MFLGSTTVIATFNHKKDNNFAKEKMYCIYVQRTIADRDFAALLSKYLHTFRTTYSEFTYSADFSRFKALQLTSALIYLVATGTNMPIEDGEALKTPARLY